jgi:uncharacterized protein (DUF488 family)
VISFPVLAFVFISFFPCSKYNIVFAKDIVIKRGNQVKDAPLVNHFDMCYIAFIMERVIYTIGTSTRSEEEFFSLLIKWDIRLLVDVRRFPKSRFPHFCRDALAVKASQSGMRYVHLGDELGGYRKGGYDEYTRTEGFKKGLARLIAEGEKEPAAILCAERFPWRCHRRFIARELVALGWQVVHIIDEKRVWSPQKKEGEE